MLNLYNGKHLYKLYIGLHFRVDRFRLTTEDLRKCMEGKKGAPEARV